MFSVNVPYGLTCCHFKGDSARSEAMLDGRVHGLLLPDEEPRHAQ